MTYIPYLNLRHFLFQDHCTLAWNKTGREADTKYRDTVNCGLLACTLSPLMTIGRVINRSKMYAQFRNCSLPTQIRTSVGEEGCLLLSSLQIGCTMTRFKCFFLPCLLWSQIKFPHIEATTGKTLSIECLENAALNFLVLW